MKTLENFTIYIFCLALFGLRYFMQSLLETLDDKKIRGRKILEVKGAVVI